MFLDDRTIQGSYCLDCFIAITKEHFNDTNRDDWCECSICGFRGKEIACHIKSDHPEHKSTYTGATKSKTMSDRVKGDKNPAYQHGGKYSPFSKNFVKGYDEEWHNETKEKISATQKVKSTFVRNSYSSDEEYSKAQTRDLDYFINKYGEIEGRAKHKAKTEKWLNTLNSKSEEEINEINARKVRKSNCFYSKAEKELFNTLKSVVPELKDQLALKSPSSNKRYVYDMVFDKKIIEYNGDFWHANPEIYSSDFVNPYNNKSTSEIHEYDANKLETANYHGYEVFTVWEKDYKNNKEKVLSECLSFLTQ